MEVGQFKMYFEGISEYYKKIEAFEVNILINDIVKINMV